MSKPSIRHFGHIKNGKKFYDNPERYRQQIASLEGRRFVEVIEKYTERRTLSQNNYYRGIILEECLKSDLFCYYDNKEDLHEEIFAKKFLKYVIERQVGDKKFNVTKYRSTAELNKEEFSEFINKVIIWLAQQGIVILDPQEYSLKK